MMKYEKLPPKFEGDNCNLIAYTFYLKHSIINSRHTLIKYSL